MTQIIDTCSFVPTSESLRQQFAVMSHNQTYLRVFGMGLAHWAGLTKAQYLATVEERSYEDAVAHIGARIGETHALTADEFVARMDAENIRTAVIHNGDYETFLGVPPLPFEYHADIARRFPGRFRLLAGVDPLKGRRAVEMLDDCVSRLGYHGLIVVPFRHGVAADHEIFKPLYRRCQELGVPAWIHSTNNWDPKFPMDMSTPRVIDRIAIDFPELVIMAGHAGWPWVLEMVTVAWRQPNVHLEVSAFRPGKMAEPGYGFEPLLHFGRGPLQDKIMFGSTWNLMNLPMRKVFDEVRELPNVSAQLADKWVHHNAARLFHLD